MCVGEVDTFLSQPIYVWDFHLWMIDGMQDPIIQIIADNE
jgi:hypothetical protein